MAAKTIEGRLLSASGAAYSIACDQATLPLDPQNIYHVGAGFVRPPSIIVRGTSDIDACLVGEIPDGIVVAFRGTLPFDFHQVPTLRDWLNDFDSRPVSAPEFFPGCVHSWFFSAFTNLRRVVVDELKRQRGDTQKPLLITGHSKGGALAALMAFHLAATQGIPVKVITFAAARPGEADFADAYQAQAIDHTRYEYNNDIVPHLPPSQDGFVDLLSRLPLTGSQFQGLRRYDYRSVGTLKYIDQNRRIHDEYLTLRIERNLALAHEIVQLHYSQIAADHAIGCGSGYMSALAPEL